METKEYIVPGQGTAQSILKQFQAWMSLIEGADFVLMDDVEIASSDTILEMIQEEPLSVLVRSGWHEPGADCEPEEYEILLGTGGPAIRIFGRLSEHLEPETAELQGQDWFKPWEPTRTSSEEDEAILWYAQQFYFGG